MLYELRQYTTRPGKRDEWIALMEEEIIPLQVAAGMVICGSFAGEEESAYVWLRRFKDEEERVRLYEAVYGSDKWKNEIAPLIPDLIDRDKIKVTRMAPTEKSVMQ